MLLFLMFVLAIILSFAVCVYVLLQQQSPRPAKSKGRAQQPSLKNSFPASGLHAAGHVRRKSVDHPLASTSGAGAGRT